MGKVSVVAVHLALMAMIVLLSAQLVGAMPEEIPAFAILFALAMNAVAAVFAIFGKSDR